MPPAHPCNTRCTLDGTQIPFWRKYSEARSTVWQKGHWQAPTCRRTTWWRWPAGRHWWWGWVTGTRWCSVSPWWSRTGGPPRWAWWPWRCARRTRAPSRRWRAQTLTRSTCRRQAAAHNAVRSAAATAGWAADADGAQSTRKAAPGARTRHGAEAGDLAQRQDVAQRQGYGEWEGSLGHLVDHTAARARNAAGRAPPPARPRAPSPPPRPAAPRPPAPPTCYFKTDFVKC